MKPIVLFIHANPVVRDDYADALGVDPDSITFINTGSFSAAYDERKGLAANYPTLHEVIARFAPNAPPDAPVILLAFSAGCWAARYYLQDAEARELCAAVMLIDGLHGQGDRALIGPELYALDALRGTKTLVVTHSQIIPPGYASTRETADRLLERLSRTRKDVDTSVHERAFHVLSSPGADGPAHVAQLTKIGVAAAADYLAPVVAGLHDTEPPPPFDDDEEDEITRRVGLGERCVDWCRAQMAAENPPSASTKASWFAICERNGNVGFLGTKFSGNHCAAAQSQAVRSCLQPGDTPPPHRARAGAKELMADAIEAGAWFSAEQVAAGWRPSVGDLAIYDRSQPGRPETNWWGHVDRVSNVIGTDYENIGANEGPGGAWRVQRTRYDHPKLLGFVHYPQPTAQPEPEGPRITEADRKHVETLVTLTMEQAEAEWWETARDDDKEGIA